MRICCLRKEARGALSAARDRTLFSRLLGNSCTVVITFGAAAVYYAGPVVLLLREVGQGSGHGLETVFMNRLIDDITKV